MIPSQAVNVDIEFDGKNFILVQIMPRLLAKITFLESPKINL